MEPTTYRYGLSGSLTIRNMVRQDLDTAIAWAKKEQWLLGLYDADCFWAIDPEGFFIAEYEGGPVGVISAVAYDNCYGFIGFYIVKPEHRGRTVGIRLYQAAFEHLGERTIGAAGVVNKLRSYALGGFREEGRVIRCRTTAQVFEVEGLVPLTNVDFAAVIDYDKQCFPCAREKFLKSWIQQPEGFGLAALSGSRELRGYGYCRKCSEGYEIGPLMADSSDVAISLIKGLMQRFAGQPIHIKIPKHNNAANSLIELFNFFPVFECGLIFKNGMPVYAREKVYALTSFEVG